MSDRVDKEDLFDYDICIVVIVHVNVFVIPISCIEDEYWLMVIRLVFRFKWDSWSTWRIVVLTGAWKNHEYYDNSSELVILCKGYNLLIEDYKL